MDSLGPDAAEKLADIEVAWSEPGDLGRMSIEAMSGRRHESATRDTVDGLRAQLAAAEIQVRAARLALAACREVREARES